MKGINQKTLNWFIAIVLISYTMAALLAIGGGVKLQIEANEFVNTCNQHWIDQIEYLCPSNLFIPGIESFDDDNQFVGWNLFNESPPRNIETLYGIKDR